MLTSLLLSAAVTTGVPLPETGKKIEPQVKAVELFAKEEWYKEQEGKEQEFTGVLQKKGGKGGPRIGFGRNNPFTLQMDKDVREVYMGGQLEKLDPYVGMKVKLIGKPVDMEVEGRRHREIWPARMLVYVGTQDGGKQLKVLAKGNWPFGSADPDKPQKPITLVLRTAAELVAATPYNNRDALPQVVEKEATAELVKLLKVQTIDWTKQMLVVATAGTQSSGGFRVDILSIQETDKNVKVNWKVTPPDGVATSAFTHAGVVALVERSVKPAVFVQQQSKKPVREPRTDDLPANPADPSESPARPAPEVEDRPAPKEDPARPRLVDEDKKTDDEAKALKIHAKTIARLATTSGAIRTPEELVKVRGDKEEPDQASAVVAKMLKVDAIDWKKRMLITVSGGVQRTGGYSVDVKGLKVKDKVLTVEWKLNTPKPGSIVTQALTHPAVTILVDRFDGEVRFDPPPPKGGIRPKFEKQ